MGMQFVWSSMLGQKLKAFIVLGDTYKPSKELKDELKRFLIAQIADYKVPSGIEFDSSIQKSDREKILRKKILVFEFGSISSRTTQAFTATSSR